MLKIYASFAEGKESITRFAVKQPFLSNRRLEYTHPPTDEMFTNHNHL